MHINIHVLHSYNVYAMHNTHMCILHSVYMILKFLVYQTSVFNMSPLKMLLLCKCWGKSYNSVASVAI